MEKKSFSESIKKEILSYDWPEDLKKILVYSFIRTNYQIKNKTFILTTTQKDFKNKICVWLKKIYKISDIQIEETQKLLKIKIQDLDFIEKLSNQIGNLVISKTEEYGAYIAGSFLGKGWINNPISKFYHFELRVKTIQHSLDITEAFDAVGIRTITIHKDNWYYTYVKKSSSISDILKLVNATEAAMLFENERIQRDVIAHYSKMEALEPYNRRKTIKASGKQIESLKKLLESQKSHLLTIEQRKLAELRIENPSLSLFDLSLIFFDRHDKNLSKSTVNSWIKKMVVLSEGE